MRWLDKYDVEKTDGINQDIKCEYFREELKKGVEVLKGNVMYL